MKNMREWAKTTEGELREKGISHLGGSGHVS